jgi:pilus assembly protein CpaB
MNRNRLVIGLTVALLLAFLLSAWVYKYIQRVSSQSVAAVPTHHIVVAAEQLELGTMLDASKLRTISWPSSDPISGACQEVAACVNRALITSVQENEPILENKLAPVDTGAGLSVTIPQGMRAVSVAVNDVVAVAGFVVPGTMVDVLVTGTAPGSINGSNAVTETILENIRVLAAGQKMVQDREGKPETVPVITLLVTPEQAAKLTMASTEGKIQLALRNTIDSKTTAPAPIFQTALFGGGAPVPSAEPVSVKHGTVTHKEPAPQPYEIEVISGNKHEIKYFPKSE